MKLGTTIHALIPCETFNNEVHIYKNGELDLIFDILSSLVRKTHYTKLTGVIDRKFYEPGHDPTAVVTSYLPMYLNCDLRQYSTTENSVPSFSDSVNTHPRLSVFPNLLYTSSHIDPWYSDLSYPVSPLDHLFTSTHLPPPTVDGQT